MKWTLQTILAAVIGAAVVLTLDVGVWALAYWGHIDLHLPSTLSYSTVDRYIKANLPAHYTFTVQDVSNFRGTGSDTLVVTADNNQDPYAKKGAPKGDISGILMLLDENQSGNYQIDFKYQPKFTVNRSQFFTDYFLGDVTATKLPTFGTTALIAQWVPFSNGAPPIIGAIFLGDAGQTRLIPVASGISDSHLPGSRTYKYKSILVRNQFNPHLRQTFDQYQLLGLAPDQTLRALYRIDNNCDGCNHSYAAEVYFFGYSSLIPGNIAPKRYSDPSVNSLLHLFVPYGF